tara:strand:- start:7780 stop:8577 length:798 start_codon:yes stop_codon:yes gene_type:complete
MDSREKFYFSVINDLITDKNSSILICCAGNIDKEIFQKAKFNNVTISNLDSRITGGEFSPYEYKHEDIMDLSLAENSYDYVVARDGIHHTSSPHRAVTEMYRVAKKGIICIESRDSFIMRILLKFGFSQEYEHAAVFYNDCKFGGVNNTEIPNYVYRWTERDIYKTISSYAPFGKHKYIFKYGTSFPTTPAEEKTNILKLLFLYIMLPFYWVFVKIFKKQQNLFAFYIEKLSFPLMLFPWLRLNKQKQTKFNKSWGEKIYKTELK